MSGDLELFGAVFARGPVAAEVSDRGWLQAMLDVEAGLARALARAGLVPPAAAEAVTAAARAEQFSSAEIGRAAEAAGNPVPALVAALGKAVPEHARQAVHFGATSQDIVDSALMLITKRSLPYLEADLAAAASSAARLAEQHAASVMLGRTLLQHATPVTFGLKAAGWLYALDQARLSLRTFARTQLLAQFGGATGTLAALGTRGAEVAGFLAQELGLIEPRLPWHTARIPVLQLSASLGLTSGTIAKIARDITLLAQSELEEVAESGGAGRGGSSTMPHKHNPIGSIAAVSCTRRVPGLVATLLSAAEQEHERGAGSWHVETETASELLRLTGSAASWLSDVLGGLRVNRQRMRENLERAGSAPLAEAVSFALIPKLGRSRAQELVKAALERAADSGQSLQHTLREAPEFSSALAEAGIDDSQLAALFEPASYLGSAPEFIGRALADHAAFETQS
jgi:3-carboxy-cis,cis-muconate cycloisomerase